MQREEILKILQEIRQIKVDSRVLDIYIIHYGIKDSLSKIYDVAVNTTIDLIEMNIINTCKNCGHREIDHQNKIGERGSCDWYDGDISKTHIDNNLFCKCEKYICEGNVI